MIEFTHRATSGIALLLVVGLVFWAFHAWPKGHPVRAAAALSGLFILSEALIGAGLVLFEHVAQNASLARGFSLSIHLLNTFTLVGVLALTAWWASGGPPISWKHAGPQRWLASAILLAMMILGVSGAIAALGDTLFPVSSLTDGVNQDFSPTAHLFVRLRVFHPGIAVVVTVLVLWAVMRTMTRQRSRLVQPLGLTVMGLLIVQMMVGALNLALLAPVWMQLVHLLAADVLWIAVVLFAAGVLLRPQLSDQPAGSSRASMVAYPE
jgi:heme A synthase